MAAGGRSRLGVVVGLLVAGGVVTALLLGAGIDLGQGDGLLSFRVGDRMTYRLTAPDGGSGHEASVEATVTGIEEVHLLTGASRQALSFKIDPTGADGRDVDDRYHYIDPESGEFIGGISETGDENIVSLDWPGCALWGSLVTPFSMLQRTDVEGERVTVVHPAKGSEYVYDVSREGNRITLTLEDARGRAECRPWMEAVIDTSTGRMVRADMEGVRWDLVSYREGTGRRVSPGAAPTGSTEHLPREPWDRRYPPGFGGHGPAEWTLADAWSTAEEDSAAVQDFLGGPEDAFVANAEFEEGAGTLGAGTAYSWTFNVLRTDGKMLRVTSNRTTDPLDETSVQAEERPPPEDVPDRFEAPSDRLTSLDAFLSHVRDHDLEPVEGERWRTFDVSFIGSDADYFYNVVLNWSTSGGDDVRSRVSNEWMMFRADTGRLDAAHLSRDYAERHLAWP